MSAPADLLASSPDKAPDWLLGDTDDERRWLRAQRAKQAPSWVMGDQIEWLHDHERRRHDTLPLEALRYDVTVTGGQILEGRAVPYLEWTEVASYSEGHFLEQWAPGALRHVIESGGVGRIKVLFEHGDDRMIGRQPIAKLTGLQEQDDGAYFRAELLSGLPPLIHAGLRRGLYASSVRFQPLDSTTEKFPQRSDWNPTALPEKTILEARIKELSVVTFPAYKGSTAQIAGEPVMAS
jgi:HK97 family phage prohead protease